MTNNKLPDDIERVRVSLPHHQYDILIGAGLLARAGELIKTQVKMQRPKLALIGDDALNQTLLPQILKAFEHADIKTDHRTLPTGEATKSFAQLEKLCGFLLDKEIERNDYIVALGGGVIGDLTGFAAAILRRGAKLIQIPTSLLAQVDSSIGGKTAINMPQGKNLIGAFHQPDLVLIDTQSLNSLPERHMRAGYAEIVKYGALGNAKFFNWLETNGAQVIARETNALTHAIKTSCRAKADIVEQDEREQNKRALLNLGHSFAHAFETLTGYDDSLLHGEAVALGMVQAFAFSARLNLCAQEEASRLAAHLHDMGLPTRLGDLPKAFTSDEIIAAMQQDKKVQAGRLRLVLARAIGDVFLTDEYDPSALREFLETQNA